ncbi:glycosyltransferase [Bacteroides gallinaceum]|uniref:Glycosyltransferase n=1 Tax=Bacteroides gallinaceum TaxID=1462571 RepID=A0ABT7VEE6_9BACE|nr:glycosyltransferase [Bacteroides gallinaceum]MDM8207261.1 glycosyltransferase [Bacteroides gallinaceum]MDM8324672.1 glycosyltransferase [Bacteroides gallinaceum]
MNHLDLKNGLSGLMRLKNEGPFIKNCVESCIDALDELIIVYNDCTDDTPEIVEEMRKRYPDKVKAYAYNNHILSHNLTEADFNIAKNLPEDSPRLHSSQCNFALSKANYKYAVKIDADQLYFTDELKKWRDVCSGDIPIKWNITFILGWFFMVYFSAYRHLSSKCRKPCLWMLPDWLFDLVITSYFNYAKWRLKKGTAAIALSGFNVFKDIKWYIPFDGFNIHPPYNGEGDTLIFRISKNTYYTKFVNYKSRSVTEKFHHSYKMMFAGPMWFHLHANREYCWSKIKKTKDEYPELFVPLEEFSLMSYKEIHNRLNKKSHTLYQRILFAFIHKAGIKKMKEYSSLLK